MIELVQANWWLFIIALLIGIAAAWWILVVNRKTHVETTRQDTLDEGAQPAQRNQALIDTPAPAAKAPQPATPTAPTPAVSPIMTPSGGDDLRRIKGVGPKLVGLLHAQGITSFAQIAAWSEAEIDRIDAQLGNFQGRIRRDNWMDQAKLLAADDTAGFEGKFGKL